MHDRFLLLKRQQDLAEQEQLVLESWLKSLPLLRDAYERKEEFYQVYEAKAEDEALDRYFAWLGKITPDLMEAFLPLILAIEHWGDEIFAYFAYNGTITNAFTEAKNGALKVANRIGRGYAFSVLRAKVLFAE